MLSNHIQADEALSAANRLCADDPLLANEQGVMEFNHGEFVLSTFSLCSQSLTHVQLRCRRHLVPARSHSGAKRTGVAGRMGNNRSEPRYIASQARVRMSSTFW
jgi:hypothetical protein